MSLPTFPSIEGESAACPVHQNVGSQERVACAMGGAGLILSGLFERGFLRQALMLTAGGALLYRGVSGYCRLYDRLGINRSDSGNEYFEPQESAYLGGS